MKVIIAGSRGINDPDVVQRAVNMSGFNITEVVCGMAKGVDMMGFQWAQEHNIPVRKFPANWNMYGKRAGIFRNAQMAVYADGLIAIWDGKSRGTENMIQKATQRNLAVFVYFAYREIEIL